MAKPSEPGEISVDLTPQELETVTRSVKTVRAIYRVLSFSGAKPTTLLGEQNFTKLIAALRATVKSWNPETTPVRLSLRAAGSESSTMRRIADSLASELAIDQDSADGNLRIRLRRSKYVERGWDALIRTSPMQLGKRPWRTVNYRGAMHGTVAAALVADLKLQAHSNVLNICSGSGTLLIEFLQQQPTIFGIAADLSAEANSIAQVHLQNAALIDQCAVTQCDASSLPFLPGSFDAVVADFPWGEALSTRSELRSVSTAWLEELIRITKQSGKMLLISQDRESWSKVIAARSDAVSLIKERKVFQGGFHPWAFYLKAKHTTSSAA